jgi:tetratricopeptide (TPR) repeat protein
MRPFSTGRSPHAHRAVVVWVVLAMGAFAGCGQTARHRLADDKQSFNAAIARGEEAETAGNLAAAAGHYRQAAEIANGNRFLESVRAAARAHSERVESSRRNAGQTVALAAAPEKATDPRAQIQAQAQAPLTKEKVLSNWQAHGESSDPSARQEAYNDVGALHLREKMYAQAAEDFRQALAMDPSQTAADKAVLHYNRARAIELWLGSPEGSTIPADKAAELRRECLQHYLTACASGPSEPAVIRGVFRGARAVQPPTDALAKQITELSTKLVNAGRAGEVLPELMTLLTAWSDSPHARTVLDALVLCLAARNITPAEFDKEYENGLKKLYLGTRNESLKAPVEQLRKAYGQAMTWITSTADVYERFSAWRDPSHAPAFSRLLKSVGDAYAADKQYDRAGARYWSAFVLDPKNFDAMLYMAVMLREHGKEFDKDRKIAQQFESLVWIEKANAYVNQPQTPAEWRKLVQIHTMLAKTYMDQKQFGPSDNPRTALFQWSRAVEAERRARALDPKTPVSPDLVEGLGQAYAAFDRPAEARKQFIAAAELSMSRKEPDAALRALTQWQRISIDASPDEHAAFKQSQEKAMAALRAPGPG